MIRVLAIRVDEAKTASEAIDFFIGIISEEHSQQLSMLDNLKSELAKLTANNPSDPKIACLTAQITIAKPISEKMSRNLVMLKHIENLLYTPPSTSHP